MTASAPVPPRVAGERATGLAGSPLFRVWFPSLVFFTLLAGEALRFSVSWVGYGLIVVVLSALAVALLVQRRDHWAVSRLPLALLAFLVYSTASLAWSAWLDNTAIGVLITWLTVIGAVALAVTFDWQELLRTLSYALRTILGLSIAFELVVSVFVRQPLLPFWTDYGSEPIPKILYWSRDLLFEGGKIQGIVGNSALLGMLALLGVIVFGIQLALGSVRWLAGWSALVLAVAVLALTRPATVLASLAAVVFTVVAVVLVRRTKTTRARWSTIAGILTVLGAGVGAGLVFREQLLSLVGKSPDLTGRLGIWDAVIGLAEQRPAFGWGWAGFWVPWNEHLGNLAPAAGIWQLQAHNAWLDVWMQLGIVGVVIFGLFVGAALVKAWQHATDRPLSAQSEGRFSWLTLLPLLLLVAYLVQSVAESRLLIEGGLALLTIVAVKTKRRELQ